MWVVKFGIIGCGLMGREFASAVARWCHLLEIDVRPEVRSPFSCPAKSDVQSDVQFAILGNKKGPTN